MEGWVLLSIVQGLGFSVECFVFGLGFMAQGLWFEVDGAWLWGEGSEFRVWGLGFRILDFRSGVRGPLSRAGRPRGLARIDGSGFEI